VSRTFAAPRAKSKGVFEDQVARTLVFKWGDCLAVRLPQELVDQLGLKEGDELNVVAARGGTIEVDSKHAQRRRALDRLANRNWILPDGYKFDRDEANER
jgi:antitoxin MazE